MPINYISTRGGAPALDFEGVLLAGLAADGGLYVPEQLPTFSREEIQAMRGLDYPSLAFEILKPFVEGSIEFSDLRRLIDEAYGSFRLY